MSASAPPSSPARAPRLVLVLVAWACVWGGVVGVGWEACEGPVCLEVRRQAEGLARLKFLRNYINQTVNMMNTLVSTLEEELVKTGEGLAQFIGPRCPAAHPLLLEVTKPADTSNPALADQDNVITDSDEDYDPHSSPPPSERERLDAAGSESQYWQAAGSSSHTNLQGSGGGSGKTLTGQKVTSSGIKTDKSSSSSTSTSTTSSSRVTSSSSSSVDSGPATTNKFNTIGGQEPSRPSHKTTAASHISVSVAPSSQEEDSSEDTQDILGLGGVGHENLGHSGSDRGNLGHGGSDRGNLGHGGSDRGNLGPSGAGRGNLGPSGAGRGNLGHGGAGRGLLGPGGAGQDILGLGRADQGNLGPGGAGRGNLGPSRGNLGQGGSGRGNLRPGDSSGANQGNWFYDWSNESHGGANRGHGGANRGHGGANRGHGDGRGRDISSGGSRSCRSVARGSPHWVPGLDQWCVTSCAAGYCPPSHCVC
ncbi:spidroin-1 [Procambarus clarkii]|uniref:spidroin-1 n=1 Tax=Procambarus clarkii TaxID=6728 RepID=UPI001E6742E4|nr:cell wall protein IFF6-like [Procambarus clarkii]